LSAKVVFGGACPAATSLAFKGVLGQNGSRGKQGAPSLVGESRTSASLMCLCSEEHSQGKTLCGTLNVWKTRSILCDTLFKYLAQSNFITEIHYECASCMLYHAWSCAGTLKFRAQFTVGCATQHRSRACKLVTQPPALPMLIAGPSCMHAFLSISVCGSVSILMCIGLSSQKQTQSDKFRHPSKLAGMQRAVASAHLLTQTY
jgi:hypothetical protein